ncbi:MAG: PAS domain S-box protein [Nitrospira sp. CR1.1]|nr:PAS domain S-box protein [Nitrospira sp. CR1.1]
MQMETTIESPLEADFCVSTPAIRNLYMPNHMPDPGDITPSIPQSGFPLDFMLAHLAAIVECSDDAIISKDLNGTITSWNRGAQHLFGYAAPEMIGQPVKRLIPEDRLNEEPRILERLRMGERIDHYETVRRRKDGTLIEISLSVSPIKNQEGRIVGASKIARGISDLKQGERNLANLLETLPAAVYTTDAEGRITRYNQAALDLWGRQPPLGVSRWSGSWRQYWTDGRLMPASECPLAQSLALNRPIRGLETIIERPDGARLPVASHTALLRNASGAAIGGVDILVDLTEQKRAERELQNSAAELERRIVERTGELLLSQERLRALASDLTLTEQRERRHLATELHDYLAQLVVASRIRLAQVIPTIHDASASVALSKIDEMLDQALTYTRSLVAELSPHILYQFGLSQSLVWLGEQMKHHGLDVAVKTMAPPFTLQDDQAVLLFQSVRELLFNVIKHAKVDRAAVTINVDEDRQELWICVEDEGIGFDVMEPGITKNTRAHFGLLSIRERMELLGGECDVSSVQGSGTAAILRLPLASVSVQSAFALTPEAPHAPPPSPKASSRNISILLVDDHAMVRQGLRSILNAYDNLTVVGEGADGQDAVMMARSLHPDVVIMDVNLPIIDGIEATRILTQEHQSITVIGISVRNDPQVQYAMTGAGAVAFLPKESAADQLYEVIVRHFPVQA